MKGKARTLLCASLVCSLFSPVAHSQTTALYPAKPIRFVVPYPPGGTTDIVARGIAAKLTERFGHQVVIDNRGGASTVIGAEAVARAAPDGYTLLLVTATTLSINPDEFARFIKTDMARAAKVIQSAGIKLTE